MNSYKGIYASLLLLLGLAAIDIVALTYFVYDQESPMDGLTSIFIIIPGIIVLNLIGAVVLYLLKRKRGALLILLNCLLAPVIYNHIAKAHYRYYRQTHFTTYYFTYKQHKFEIELEKDYHSYSFSDITDQASGSSTGFMGDYKLNNDSIILIDSTRRPVIFDHKLFGYPTSKDTILLKDKGE